MCLYVDYTSLITVGEKWGREKHFLLLHAVTQLRLKLNKQAKMINQCFILWHNDVLTTFELLEKKLKVLLDI